MPMTSMSMSAELQRAAQASGIGLWEWDAAAGVMAWSDAMTTIYGHAPDAAAEPEDAFRSGLHLEDRVQVLTEMRAHIATGLTELRQEFRVVRPDGAVRWIESVAEVARDGVGRPIGMAGVSIDVTDRRRVEQALRDADRRKDEFLATLAHELRNPLAPIRIGLELLRRRGPRDDTASRTQDMMGRQLDHLVRLVDDLLDVSRIGRGKLELEPVRIEVRTVLAHAVEMSRPWIEASGHTLVVQPPDVPVWIDGDLTRLGQVLGNLLNNAAKYTPSGGRISLRAGVEGGGVVIRVDDDGIGIAAEMLPRVFGLFAQVDHTLRRAQGGLGIGLSLARTLVERHGGTLVAESLGLGRGSTFTVRLPLASAGDVRASPASELPRARASSRRVLVVDDNSDVAESLVMLLELSGHEATTATSGPAALEAVRTFQPEVVFLDIGMPGMDGYEVARRLRSDPTTAGVVLVALTGWGGDDDKSRAAGFALHLVKPVRPADVADALARCATLRRPR